MKKIIRTVAMATAVAFGFASANATVLLDADFSKCTAGSEEAPEMFKYSFDFTGLGYTGWSLTSTTNAGQAGGVLYLADGGGVKTPNLSGVTTNGGGIKLTVVVKLNKAEEGLVQLKYGYGDATPIYVAGSDWQTIEQVVTPSSTSSYSNNLTVSPFLLANGIFVKSIKIEQSSEFLGSTTAFLPTDADGTSFTARWKAVTGATKYFLDVYSYGEDERKVLFIENQEVATTSYTVTGLNPDITYYYVVRAANEAGVSDDSNEIEVVKVVSELAKPVVALASSDKDGNFTATWDAVADADSYNVSVKKSVTLVEDGLANVFAESFDVFTEGTIEQIEYAYDRHLEMLTEPGWTGESLCMISGAIGFSPYGTTFLATPALDLSADNGNVTVVVKAAYVYLGAFKAGTKIKLSLVDAEENETAPVEIDIDQIGFADYTVKLTGGTATSKVKISYDESSSLNKVLFDNFEIKQIMPAGTVNTSVYLSEDVTATEYTGKVEPAENTTYTLFVTAQGRTVDAGEVVPVFSEISEGVLIDLNSGVEGVSTEVAKNVTVKGLGNGTVEITAATATNVEVYDLTGRMLTSARVSEGTATLNIGFRGVVIVKAGDDVTKIAL